MLFGALASVSAAILWAGSFGTYRRFAEDVSSFSLNIFKNSLALLAFLIAIVIMQIVVPSKGPLHHSSWVYLGLSGIFGIALGDTALFQSLKILGARSASILFCLSPLFTIFIGYFFLHETLSFYEGLGIFITLMGVAGVLYFDRHDGEGAHQSFGASDLNNKSSVVSDAKSLAKSKITQGILYGILSAFLNGVGVALARKGFQGTDALLGSTIRMAPAILILVIIAAAQGRLKKSVDEISEAKHLGILSVTVFMGGFVGILLASVGTIYLKAGLAATLTSSVPIWTFMFDHFIYRKATKPIALPFVFTTLVGLYFIFY